MTTEKSVDDELDELLVENEGTAKSELDHFRTKLREILNEELAVHREELQKIFASEREAFFGEMRSRTSKLLYESSVSAARRTKLYVEATLKNLKEAPPSE